MPSALRLFSDLGDAETALIKSILERHKFSYAVHDISDARQLERMHKLCGASARPPILLVGRHLQWTAAMLPELEKSGELVKVVKHERELAIARDEYRWGVAFLHGREPGSVRSSSSGGLSGSDKTGDGGVTQANKENGGVGAVGAGGGFVSVGHSRTAAPRQPGAIRRDPFVAYEWFRRSARRGDPKGMAALATLLVSGEAGLIDETEAARWYEAAAAGGCRSALVALGSLRLKQAERGPDGAQNRLASAVRSFRRAAEMGAADAWVWLAQAQERLERLNASKAGSGGPSRATILGEARLRWSWRET